MALRTCVANFRQYLISGKLKRTNINCCNVKITLKASRYFSSKEGSRPSYSKAFAVIGTLGIGGGVYGYVSSIPEKNKTTVYDPIMTQRNYDTCEIPVLKPSREVVGPAQNFGLDLTLYQYQTCPFCCKVRAFLDYHGISYKVIEVNPVMRQQIKFSKYKKVPILIAEEKDSQLKHQLNDSSVIISILGTYLLKTNNMDELESILKYYEPHVYKNDEGKEVEEVLNQYFIMYGENQAKSPEIVKKEVEWRKWADKELVHILSPNIYRTYDEALAAFRYFSKVGEWEKNFSALERNVVIYVGATAMYFVGKRLKKKYSLKENVRDSLYDACKLWTKEIGNKKYMGGSTPSLADLAVYGLLSSIEGCLTFKDLLQNTEIGEWYYNVKKEVDKHHGYYQLK